MFDFFHKEVLDGIWYWDLESPENEWMSPSFWQTLGYDATSMQHKVSEWQSIIYPEDLAIAELNFKMHMNDPSHPYDQYVRYKHKKGHVVWVRCRGFAIHNTQGVATRFLGIHLDVTSLMAKQERLLKDKIAREQELRQLESLQIENRHLLAENKTLNQKLDELSQFESVPFLHRAVEFWQQAERLISSAQRLNHTINIISLSVLNADTIVQMYGEHERDAKIQTLVDQLHDRLPDALITSFLNNELIAITIGYSDIEFATIDKQLNTHIKDYKWGIISPVVKSYCLTELPNSSIDQIQKLIIAASQGAS
ncbi:PAS domain-containing protein [Saccharobesus litoralis]|nr:PAS domain-containing protein [Saccharobesus litoralis]